MLQRFALFSVLAAGLMCAAPAQAGHITHFGSVDAIDHVFGPGGGLFAGVLTSGTDDSWMVFNATAGDNLVVTFSTNESFQQGAVFREVTNGVVEVGDLAGVTNWTTSNLGLGTDLVVAHGLFANQHNFGTGVGGSAVLNLAVTVTGQYVIGVTTNNEDGSRAGPFTVDLQGNTVPIPEPASCALLGVALAVVVYGARKKKATA